MLALKQQREEATLLARDLENAQRIYDGALQRYGMSSMEAQTTQTDIAVLNPATPPGGPSSPRVFLNIEDYLYYNSGGRSNSAFREVVAYLRSSPSCGHCT